MDNQRITHAQGESARRSPAQTPPGTTADPFFAAPGLGVAVRLLPSGERLAGRYRLRGLLGRGGMGDVYEAEDEELSILVALKALRLQPGPDDGARSALGRLKSEVLVARSITHPNVCRVYDLGRHQVNGDSLWFLTMELLRGETLQARLRHRGALPAGEALALVEQMISGLAAAHRAGVLHLDFKSGNVIVARNGNPEERVVVTDFGLSRQWLAAGGATGGSADLAGTPPYMAPEQLLGGEASPASDIYALGVVLYEIATGVLPFAGMTSIEGARRQLLAGTPSPRTIATDLDERWEAVILRCLAREPGNRFARVEEVWEALQGHGPLDVVPLVRFSLPGERDAFVGREGELADLEERVQRRGARLVTLLGAAGMGKTRLALRYGWQSLSTWPGGVRFCDLSAARSLEGIVWSVAQGLGVTLVQGDPVAQIGHAITGCGRCLIILDNFEQVVGYAEATLGPWMERAPQSRFVVTSRERLGVSGEEVQVVEPLSVEPGVALFVERAQRQRPGFAPDQAEREAAREVVRLAEGMPLAIELGAARMRVMTVQELAVRMREQLRVLGGGGTGRHGSVRAAIAGSWELMQPAERAAWSQCAVFEGGFTLAAAEGVIDLKPWPEMPSVVDVMQALVDKSLLTMWVPERATGERPEARFKLYAALQEFALERLREVGNDAVRSAEERHGQWYARYGREDELAALDLRGGVERRRQLGRETENLIAACRRAVRRGDGETAARTYVAAWSVLELRGPWSTGVTLGEEVLCLPLSATDRARVLQAIGSATWLSGSLQEALAHLEAALAVARAAEDRHSEGQVLGDLARLHGIQGQVGEALALFDAALAIARESGGRQLEGGLLSRLGTLRHRQGRAEESQRIFEEALEIAREIGDRRSEGHLLGNLGNVYSQLGRKEEARVLLTAGLDIAREIGNRRSEGIVLGNLANVCFEQGRLAEAQATFEAALAVARELGDRHIEGDVLGNLGSLLYEQGRVESAQSLFEAALVIARETRDLHHEGVVLGNLGNLHTKQGRIEEARTCYEQALALAREAGHRHTESVSLAELGLLHRKQGEMAEAQLRLDAALAIAREVGDRHLEAVILTNLGDLQRTQGRLPDAREILDQAAVILRAVDDPSDLAKLICILAEVLLDLGDQAGAAAAFHEAELLAARVGSGPESALERTVAELRVRFSPGE
jgi:predicted ATPase/predicted negative regulator of RcsB-dependent stress response